MSANVLVMSDLNSRPDFPALRKPDETCDPVARQRLSAGLARFAALFKSGKPTVPYVELLLLLGLLALVFD
jgi:hypothetical protein